jgi:hypothetical protein
MPTDATSGEVEICYGLLNLTDKCFVYQQDSVSATYDVSRVIAGLPLGDYTVKITEKDDGFSATNSVLGTPRLPLGITIDSVTIFGAESVPASITQIGQYEQDAKNGSMPYLVKVPGGNWRDFAAATWTGGTASQVTTTAGVVSNVNAGATAVMVIDKSLENPTVIVYNRVPTSQSTTLLVCASSDTTRVTLLPNIVGGVDWTGTAFTLKATSIGKCILHNLRSGNQIILTSTELTALANNTHDKLITFTTLTPGGFNLDAFEVIEGVTLPAGLHDEIKPLALLNFQNSSGNSAIGTAANCNPRLGWCTSKLKTLYGGSAAYTRQRGSHLNFSFRGTGFSILSSVNLYGSDMRICLAPSTALNPFPIGTDANRAIYGIPAGLEETWCDVVTTKYTQQEWVGTATVPGKNPDRIYPESAATQYGFAYYGLEAGDYQVEARLIDTAMTTSDSLTIDAVAIFGIDPFGMPSAVPPIAPIVLEADGRQANLFDDREPEIAYEPSVNWTAATSTTQPPLFKTEMRGTKAGSIVRLRVDGNAISIYQTMRADAMVLQPSGSYLFVPGNTRDMRVCLMVGDGPIPCEPEAMEIGERATASYRQSAMNGAGIPILIYGLGPGEHNIIIENRDMRTMSIDAIRVHP